MNLGDVETPSRTEALPITNDLRIDFKDLRRENVLERKKTQLDKKIIIYVDRRHKVALTLLENGLWMREYKNNKRQRLKLGRSQILGCPGLSVYVGNDYLIFELDKKSKPGKITYLINDFPTWERDNFILLPEESTGDVEVSRKRIKLLAALALLAVAVLLGSREACEADAATEETDGAIQPHPATSDPSAVSKE